MNPVRTSLHPHLKLGMFYFGERNHNKFTATSKYVFIHHLKCKNSTKLYVHLQIFGIQDISLSFPYKEEKRKEQCTTPSLCIHITYRLHASRYRDLVMAARVNQQLPPLHMTAACFAHVQIHLKNSTFAYSIVCLHCISPLPCSAKLTRRSEKLQRPLHG